jgi:uridylate kinase
MPALPRHNNADTSIAMSAKPAYQRILLKLSGEALMGRMDFGISPEVMSFLAHEIKGVVETGVQVALVVGGGNIFRGEGLARSGMDRVTGDQMGMLATVINGLALQDAIERIDVPVRVQSAIRINEVCEDYIRRKAVRHLEKGRVVIFSAGTGNPFFTTDSAAALRAIEINADLMLKATKVDGVYTADPKKQADARRYAELTYDEALAKRLAVMDQTAMVLCRDHGVLLRVYDMERPGALRAIVMGDTSIGTQVHA